MAKNGSGEQQNGKKDTDLCHKHQGHRPAVSQRSSQQFEISEEGAVADGQKGGLNVVRCQYLLSSQPELEKGNIDRVAVTDQHGRKGLYGQSQKQVKLGPMTEHLPKFSADGNTLDLSERNSFNRFQRYHSRFIEAQCQKGWLPRSLKG